MAETLCPYCGRAMRKGRIWGHNRLSWQPEGGGNIAILRGGVPSGGVALPGKFDYITGHRVPAFCCPDCGKILLDTRP